MRVIVRYRGVPLLDSQLAPGTYSLGRGADQDLQVLHPEVRRREGTLQVLDEGSARYLRATESEGSSPATLTDAAPLPIGEHLELVTARFVELHETGRHPVLPGTARRRRVHLAFAALVALIAVGAAIGGVAWFGNRALEPAEILPRVRPSIVQLERLPDPEVIGPLTEHSRLSMDDFHESESYCSGFIVGPSVVLTANTCVRHPSGRVRTDFRVRTHDGNRHRPTRILGFDVRRNYCFLEVPTVRSYPAIPLETTSEIGATVYTIGDVSGSGVAIREGIRAATTTDLDRSDIEYLRFSAAASSENRGGPLVDSRARAIGVVLGPSEDEAYSLATDARAVAEELERIRAGARRTMTIPLWDRRPNVSYTAAAELGYGSPEIISDPSDEQAWGELRFRQTVPSSLEALDRQTAEELDTAFGRAVELQESRVRPDRPLAWSQMVDESHPFVPLAPCDSSIRRLGEAAVSGSLAIHGSTTGEQRASRPETLRLGCGTPIGLDTRGQPTTWSYHHRPLFVVLEPTLYRVRPSDLEIATFGPAPPQAAEVFEALFKDDKPALSTRDMPGLRPGVEGVVELRELPSSARERAIEDGRGRPWRLLSMNFYGVQVVHEFCKRVPHGEYCTPSTSPAMSEPWHEAWIRNRSEALSHQILSPSYFRTDDLLSFESEDDFVVPTDVELSRHPPHVRLGTADVSVDLDETRLPVGIRVRRSLLRRPDGEAEWIGSAIDLVFADQERFCSVSVEVPQEPEPSDPMSRFADGFQRRHAIALPGVAAQVRAVCWPMRRSAEGWTVDRWQLPDERQPFELHLPD